MMRRLIKPGCSAFLLLAAPCLLLGDLPAPAQTRTLAEIAGDTSPGRTQRLIEGAKKEGALSFYTSLVAEDTTPMIDGVQEEVRHRRPGSGAAARRPSCSARSRSTAPGAVPPTPIFPGPPAVEPLHRENMLQAVKSPLIADVMPQARQPHGEYVGVFVNLFAAAYNTTWCGRTRYRSATRT